MPANKARRRHDGKNVLQAMQQEQIANCTVPKVDENCSLQDISQHRQKKLSMGWVASKPKD